MKTIEEQAKDNREQYPAICGYVAEQSFLDGAKAQEQVDMELLRKCWNDCLRKFSDLPPALYHMKFEQWLTQNNENFKALTHQQKQGDGNTH